MFWIGALIAFCFFFPEETASECKYENEWECTPIAKYETRGTHNSYHQRVTNYLIPNSYSHDAILSQLNNGIRGLEFDMYVCDNNTNNSTICDDYPVGHIKYYDYNSSCHSIKECLSIVFQWSNIYYNHFPLFIKFQPRDYFNLVWNSNHYNALSEILTNFFEDKLFTPYKFGLRTTNMNQNWDELSWKHILLGDLRGSIVPFFTYEITSAVLNENIIWPNINIFPSCLMSNFNLSYCKMLEGNTINDVESLFANFEPGVDGLERDDFILMRYVDGNITLVELPGIEYIPSNNSVKRLVNNISIIETIDQWTAEQTFANIDYNNNNVITSNDIIYMVDNYTISTNGITIAQISEICFILGFQPCSPFTVTQLAQILNVIQISNPSLYSNLVFTMVPTSAQYESMVYIEYGINILNTDHPFFVNDINNEWIFTLKCDNNNNTSIRMKSHCLKIKHTKCNHFTNKCSIDQIESIEHN